MPITMPCPSCRASLTFADVLVGKTVKCKQCGEAVTVAAPAARAAVAKPAATAAKVATAAAPARVAVARKPDDTPKPMKAVARRRDDDDDDDDAPRKKPGKRKKEAEKKSMTLPILLGVLGVLAVVGGVVFLANREKTPSTEVAATNTEGTTGGADRTVPPPTTKPTTPPTKTETFTSPASAPIPSPPKVGPTPITKPPVETTSKGPLPGFVYKRPTRDLPDAETMERMKKASVYLEVEDGKGGGSSGSGWLGLESNLIFTNAHVVGMISPGSKPPTKITAFLNSGEAAIQVEIPNAKLKLLAVDRDMDLAVIEIINVKDLPPPLLLRPSADLQTLEKVVALGYPGGRRLAVRNRSADPPAVTVSETKVQAFRKDANGNLYSVQVQGGIVHGNSGGPICDADGNCIGVAVRVDLDREGRFTNIAYGVPTEYVHGLIAGRIANVEYGQAYYKEGKVAVPVTVRCLDPKKKLQEVGIVAWVGDEDKLPRPPGTALTAKPSDTEAIETKLTYDPAKQVATGEVIFPPPEAGRSYWTQPYYSNAIVPKYYMGGTMAKLSGNPVEQVPADLVARYRQGSKRVVTVQSTTDRTEFEEGEGADREERGLQQMTFKMNEQVVKSPDPAFHVGVNYGFTSWELGQVQGVQSQRYPRSLVQPIVEALKNTALVAKVDKNGVFALVSFSPINAQTQFEPGAAQLMQILGNEAFDIIKKGSIPLPGKKLNAGESWTGTNTISFKVAQSRPVPKGPNGAPPPPPSMKEFRAKEEITYTYLGLRDHGGKKEIVVKVEGTVVPATGAATGTATGTIKGIVRLEEGTGMVVDSEIKHEFEVDTSEKGMKKRMSGIEDFKITRSPAGN